MVTHVTSRITTSGMKSRLLTWHLLLPEGKEWELQALIAPPLMSTRLWSRIKSCYCSQLWQMKIWRTYGSLSLGPNVKILTSNSLLASFWKWDYHAPFLPASCECKYRFIVILQKGNIIIASQGLLDLQYCLSVEQEESSLCQGSGIYPGFILSPQKTPWNGSMCYLTPPGWDQILSSLQTTHWQRNWYTLFSLVGV